MRKVFNILILSAFLLSSCGIKKFFTNGYDFSLFSKGTVFTGKTQEGKTLYFVRNNETEMAGICFMDNHQAVAEVVSFTADSMGATTFVCGDEFYSGKMAVKKSAKAIVLTMPQVAALGGGGKQKIRLQIFRMIPEKPLCLERYKDRVFDNFVVEEDIQFGTAFGYYTSKPSDYLSKDDYSAWLKEIFSTTKEHSGFLFPKNEEELPLLLDIYQPKNDNVRKRPLILFIHGGAFFFGDKKTILQGVITEDMVKKGFVLASINYRLGTSISVNAIERTIYREVQDARAALRFLIHHKERYGIDEDQIYLVGSSAGGIVALTTAFMEPHEVFSSTHRGWLRLRRDLGGLDDSGNELQAEIKVKGVASMWGGVTDLNFINNHIPTLLFHGTEDAIVPNNEGLPFKDAMGGFVHTVLTWFGKVYGSEPIYHRLQSLNVPVKYVPFEGLGHDPCIEPDNSPNEIMDVIRDELADFLFNNVSQHYFNYWLTGYTSVKMETLTPVYKVDNLWGASVQWHIEGGFITNQTNDSIRVIWYNSGNTGVITACITDDKGTSCKRELTVYIN